MYERDRTKEKESDTILQMTLEMRSNIEIKAKWQTESKSNQY